jgi:hypothetical protein
MMNKPLEAYYKTNPILARSQARKLYRHLKAVAIEILQEEMKQTSSNRKPTWKMAIRALKDKL